VDPSRQFPFFVVAELLADCDAELARFMFVTRVKQLFEFRVSLSVLEHLHYHYNDWNWSVTGEILYRECTARSHLGDQYPIRTDHKRPNCGTVAHTSSSGSSTGRRTVPRW